MSDLSIKQTPTQPIPSLKFTSTPEVQPQETPTPKAPLDRSTFLESGLQSVKSTVLNVVEERQQLQREIRSVSPEQLQASLASLSVESPVPVVQVQAPKLSMVQRMNNLMNKMEVLRSTAPEEFQLAKQSLDGISSSIELATESPAGSVAIQNHQEAIGKLKERLNELKAKLSEDIDVRLNTPQEMSSHDLERVADMRETMIKELDAQLSSLDDKNSYLERQRIENPTTKKEIARAKSMWTESALNEINQQIKKYAGDDTKVQELTRVRDMLQERIEMFRNEKDETAITGKGTIKALMGAKKEGFFSFGLKTKGAIKKTLEEFEQGKIRWSSQNMREQDMLKTIMAETYKKIGIPAKGHDLVERLEHQHIQLLNNQPWQPIHKDIHIGLPNGDSVAFKSKIVPAANLGNKFDEYEGKGISCATSDERVHAVNLATSEFTDSSGKVLFQGLRHGIHSAFGLEDGEERAKANKSRAAETIRAAIVNNPQLLAKAMRGEPIELNLSSISLVTPDAFRGPISDDIAPTSIGKLKKDNEKVMLAEQLAAWKEFDGKSSPLTIKGPDGNDIEIKVTANILAFNFGVNAGAVNWYSGVAGGWDFSNKTNTEAMARLIGEDGLVSKRLTKIDDMLTTGHHDTEERPLSKEECEQLTKDKEIIGQLKSQIKDIWDSEAYKTSGPDPYKMVSRLALLTHMIGDTPLWNCKSGKDRTGELDVEAKFLAVQIQLSGKVPDFDQELTPSEQAMFREIALNSGNLEMQRLNVSAGGFKLEGVDAITERLGGKEAKEVHRGLSSHFES